MRLSCTIALLCTLATSSTLQAADFVRGDANVSGAVDIADAVLALGHLFQGESVDCLDAIDVNDDGAADVSDPVSLLSYLFITGAIPAPFPMCGADPTPDTLDCVDGGCASDPPLDLTYSDTMPSYFLGLPIIDNVPTSTGGAVDEYIVAPLLPSGVTIDAVTGVISGAPTVLWPATDHVVVASNSAGSTFTTINVTVIDDPPASLSYSTPVAVYLLDQPIAPNVPSSTGGPVISYSVSPNLPNGLDLDTATGVISGAPTEAWPETSHAVIGSNPTGSAFTTISIRVISPTENGNSFEVGPQLETPRYFHTATTLDDGRVLIVGGSDENSFTSLDTVEVFDPTLADPSGSFLGDFIDTNFLGTPIVLPTGGRIDHTSTLLDDGSALVCGGTFDILIAPASESGFRFDPLTRVFSPTANPMITPRFRHTATPMANGKVLIVGGQASVAETIIDPNFPPGSPFFQFDITVFPSVRDVEFFDPTTNEFSPALDITGSTTELQTPRGRSSHASTTIAGFDSVLGTADDIVLFAGGFQTLSGVFAPDLKFLGFLGQSIQSSIEFYDQTTGFNSTLPGLTGSDRVRGSLTNLGSFGDQTWDGEGGLTNAVLVSNGDTNDAQCANSTIPGELFAFTFTGFGPASGIIALEIEPPTAVQGVETAASCGAVFGRTFAPVIPLANRRIRNGTAVDGTWLFTAGGVAVTVPPSGCTQDVIGCDLTVQGGEFFDAQYNADIDPPWDLAATRSTQNPTGVQGTWLRTDDDIPDDALAGFGDASAIVTLNSARLGHTLSRLAGPDEQLGTADDFVLIVGGGTEYWGSWGGPAVSVGSEVYLPPAPAL